MKQNKGFTLIELLLVISIIGFLSSVVLSSFASVRTKAQATQLLVEFQQVEKALYMMAHDQNRSLWWSDDDYNSVECNGIIPGSDKTGATQGNPSLGTLVQNATFSKFFPSNVDLQIGNNLQYDNDCDLGTGVFDLDGDGCDTVARVGRGTLLQMTSVTDNAIFDYMDRIIDGGDESVPFLCGRIRLNDAGDIIYYMISNSGNIE
ncbi:MAG: type II secretion system protein [Candidatus Pacebacteria bacterium]|nr:type II secretion system protein [Candidatus Paceibacterota bacterium]